MSGKNLRLGLRHVHNGTRHASDHNNATGSLSLHEVAGNRAREEVGSVNVDSPELAKTVDRIVDSFEIFGEASRGNQVVNLAVLLDDFGNASINRFGIADIGVVGGDLGNARRIAY